MTLEIEEQKDDLNDNEIKSSDADEQDVVHNEELDEVDKDLIEKIKKECVNGNLVER